MIKDYLEKNKEEFKRWLVDNEQGRVDIKILPYLKDIENGFFVEAGALDGLFMSNTKILEDLGWTGLLIEPSHKAAIKCRENRKATVEECCLVSKEYGRDTIFGDFVLDGEYGMGAWSSVNHHTYGQLMGKSFQSFITEVRAQTLESILKIHEIGKVDFLSLDVEGYELEVLKGIDFDKVKIGFILVEVNLKDYTLQNMDDFLGEKGYGNLGCLSNFSQEAVPDWEGSHQDYLFGLNSK